MTVGAYSGSKSAANTVNLEVLMNSRPTSSSQGSSASNSGGTTVGVQPTPGGNVTADAKPSLPTSSTVNKRMDRNVMAIIPRSMITQKRSSTGERTIEDREQPVIARKTSDGKTVYCNVITLQHKHAATLASKDSHSNRDDRPRPTPADEPLDKIARLEPIDNTARLNPTAMGLINENESRGSSSFSSFRGVETPMDVDLDGPTETRSSSVENTDTQRSNARIRLRSIEEMITETKTFGSITDSNGHCDNSVANACDRDETTTSANGTPRNINTVINTTASNQNVNTMPANQNLQTLNRDTMRQAYNDWINCVKREEETGNIPIHQAALENDYTLLARQCLLLIGRRMSLDTKNFARRTPLHLAIMCGHMRAATMLRSFGARLDETDSAGNTALHLALLSNHSGALKSLLTPTRNKKEDVPINKYNDGGYTPLHLCSIRDKPEDAQLLLDNNADPNLTDMHSGRTALFLAVEFERTEMLQLLLKARALPMIPNYAGHTAQMLVSEGGTINPEIRNILEKRIYDMDLPVLRRRERDRKRKK